MVSPEDPSQVLISVHTDGLALPSTETSDQRRAQGSDLLPLPPKLTFLPGTKDQP